MSNDDLIVFGAGFGRTGTMSLKVALETLGVGPCHHMAEGEDFMSDKFRTFKFKEKNWSFEVINYGQLGKWIDIEHSAQTQDEKDEILKSCLSLVFILIQKNTSSVIVWTSSSVENFGPQQISGLRNGPLRTGGLIILGRGPYIMDF